MLLTTRNACMLDNIHNIKSQSRGQQLQDSKQIQLLSAAGMCELPKSVPGCRLFKQPLYNLHQELEAMVSGNVLEHCQPFSEDIGRLCALHLPSTHLALPC